MTEDDFQPIGVPDCAATWPISVETADWFEATVDRSGVSRRVAHVNNAEYVRWIDIVAVLAGVRAGSTRERLERDNLLWFVARHEIDYRGETFPDDRIVAGTWLSDWTRVSVVRHTFIGRPSDRQVLVTARTKWVLVDGETRRPTRIPPDFLRQDPDPAA